MEGESFVNLVETLERGSIPHAEEDPEGESAVARLRSNVKRGARSREATRVV
jgi:hypothetical protein